MREEADLRATFTAIGRALGENDVPALERLYAEDYQGHDIRGEVEDRATILGAFSPGGVHDYRLEEAAFTAEVQRDVGLVTGCGTVSGRWGDTAFRHRVRFLEIYLWRDGRWQCYRSQSTEIQPG